MAEGEREETYRDETEQKRQRECLIRTDNPCRRLSASRYADNFFFHSNLQMFQRLKSQVCLSVWCLCDSRAQSRPLLFNFDSNLECSSCNYLTL